MLFQVKQNSSQRKKITKPSMKYGLQFQVSFMVWNTVDYKEDTVHDFFTYGFVSKDEKKNYM